MGFWEEGPQPCLSITHSVGRFTTLSIEAIEPRAGSWRNFLPLPKESSVLSVIELFAQLPDLGLCRGESGFDLLPVNVR